jgi:septum formation protein
MLLLASASPARRRLLEQAAIPHRIAVSGVDERAIIDPDPQRLVQRLAQAKAAAVRDRLSPSDPQWQGREEPDTAAAGDDGAIDAVLGCDSLLTCAGEVFGKPPTAAVAAARWRRMAGGWAELHTGHCLLPVAGSAEMRLCTVTTRVLFASLSEAAIQAYVASGEPLACAGGFALEGRGGALVERIEGCVSNVIGLSLPLLRRWLEMPLA